MAINPETQYPGKIAPSTPDYPYGAARNITVPGDGTGTPWEAALVNDIFGWQQSILSEGQVVPSGTPEKASDSQYMTALKRIFQAQSFDTLADLAALQTSGGGVLKGSELSARQALVVTKWHNSTSKVGGAWYEIITAAEAVTRGITVDGSGSPNYIGVNHYVGGGSDYVAVLLPGDFISLSSVGILTGYNGGAAPINAALNWAQTKGVNVDGSALGAITVTSAIEPLNGVTLDIRGTEITAGAEMTAIIAKVSNIENWEVIGGVLDANAQPNTGCIQHTLGYSRNVKYRGTEVKGTEGSWQIKIGYAQGTPSTPGNEASNVVNRSYDVVLEDIIFGDHNVTTLEQLILVNAEEVDVIRPKFSNNTTVTFSALVFAYSENVRFIRPVFEEFSSRALGVQQSTNVKVYDPVFKTAAVTPNSLVQVINSYEVNVIRPKAEIFAPVDGGPVALGVYNFGGTTFEGGNLENKYDRCRDVYIDDAPSLRGCFGILQVPFQKQADKSFIFERIGSRNNTAENLTGQPYIIGAYTVVDAPNQPEGISDISLNDRIVQHQSGLSGACLIQGTATADIARISVRSDFPASQKANSKNIVASYCTELKARGDHKVAGDNAVVDLDSTVTDYDIQINANGHRVDRANSLGNVGGANVRFDDILKTRKLKNTQGSAVPANAPVVLKSVANGDEFTLSNTVDDYRALGVTAASSNDGDYATVVTQGRAECVVNGVVAIGDRLGISTTQGEAATTSNSADSVAMAFGASGGGTATIDCLVNFKGA